MKRFAPAADRNRGPILEELRSILPAGRELHVLEIASGSGQHAAFFAAELPHLVWHPSDVGGTALESVEAYRAESCLANLQPPMRLDVTTATAEEVRSALGDGVAALDAIVAINLVHISPWSASEGVFRLAADLLGAAGALILYGPYRFHGVFTVGSNEAFDRGLRDEDPRWGVRDVDDLDALGGRHGLVRTTCSALPANNHVLVYRR